MSLEKPNFRKYSRRDFLSLSFYLGASSIISSLGSGEDETDIGEALVLNERVSEILSYYTPLSFDSEGNLIRQNLESEEEDGRVAVLPTARNKKDRKLVEKVGLLVMHYDGAVRFLSDGTERNARNTVYDLNGNLSRRDGLGASTHWCLDGFPISRNENGEGGYGVLQSQEASGDANYPYQGRHVLIGINLRTGEPDMTRFGTLELFEKLEIRSNLQNLVEQKITNLDKYTVGFEQIGTKYDLGFPDLNQPPLQQYANSLTVTIACIKQFNLTPWDVVGHHEIQQKSDPGHYYMGTLRFLIGVAALKGLVPQELVFDESDGERKEIKYFEKVAKSVEQINRYSRYDIWEDYVGYRDLVASLERWCRLNLVKNQFGVV